MQIGVYDRFASDVKWEAQINTSADFASQRIEGAETAFDVNLMAEAELVEYHRRLGGEVDGGLSVVAFRGEGPHFVVAF